ncbi:MAG: TraB/GumN family protein [Pseudomonadota bacterium]
MQWIRGFAAAAVFFTGTSMAQAACVGSNVLDDLEQRDPEVYDGIFEMAAGVPNGEGRFWRVEHPGAPPSFLFGTFHTPQAVATVTPVIWSELDSARIAIFEMSLDEQAAMEQRLATDPSFAFDFNAPPLSSRLSSEQLGILSEALQTRGMSLQAAEQMRPWLLFTLLGFPACHIQAIAEGGDPLDKEMALRAGERDTPVMGLETYEEALGAFQRIRAERFLSMMVATGAMVADEEDVFRTNSDLYEDGHIAAINEFSIWLSEQQGVVSDSRALNTEIMAEILDARNRAWMPDLVREMRKGRAFVGVGALHLPGREGLVELLRARGFTVTRVDP